MINIDEVTQEDIQILGNIVSVLLETYTMEEVIKMIDTIVSNS